MADENFLDELREFLGDEDSAEEEEDSTEESEDNEPDEVAALRAEVEALRTDAQATRNFRANPAQSLNQLAAELGFRLEPQAPQSESQSGQYDPVVQEAVREAFAGNDDIGFLKPTFEKALSRSLEKIVRPIEEMSAREKASQRQSVVRNIEAQMDREYPNWREHNDDMQSLGTFLRDALNGGDLNHPKFGNLYSLAYKLVTGDGASTAKAAKRLSQASRNSTRTGGTGTTKSDPIKKIKEAKTLDDQLSYAIDSALSDLGL